MARVLSGVALGAVFFAIVWFSSATVLLFVALGVCALAFHELAALFRQLGVEVPRLVTLLATMAAVVIVPFPYVAGEAVVTIGVLAIAVAAMTRHARHAGESTAERVASDAALASRAGFVSALHAVAAGALSIVYLGLPLGALVGVHIFGGRLAVVLLIAAVAVSDTAQYYSGRLLGRHPLASRLSPKKTIEGALGGLLVTPAVLYFVGPALVPVAGPVVIALVGVVLVAAGIAGDLFESMIKRAADMKDSSALIPGHGGVLDRIDALLFAAPVFYVYLRWQYATAGLTP